MSKPYPLLEPISVSKPVRDTSPERSYWSSFRPVKHAQGPSAITGLSWRPLPPYDLAFSSGARVDVLSASSLDLRHSISRFHAVARSPVYRPDGALIATASDDGSLRVCDSQTRAELRFFRASRSPLRSVSFALSGSKTVCVRLLSFPVRIFTCSAAFPIVMTFFVTGSLIML